MNVADFAPPGGNGYLIGKTTNPNVAGWRVATEGTDTIQLKLVRPADAGALQVDATKLPKATWFHVAALYLPGDHADVYVNGQSAATGLAPAGIVEDEAATVHIGCRAGNALHLDGILDEVRVYTRALSASEVAALAR